MFSATMFVVNTRIEKGVSAMEVYGQIAIDQSIANFQSESAKAPYSDGSSMSLAYSNYLDTLYGVGALRDIAVELRAGYASGIYAGNMALPFLDKDKVEIAATQNVNLQLASYSNELKRQFIELDNISIKITDFNLVFRDSDTDMGVFGNSSSFGSYSGGGDKYYDYTVYPSYYLEFETTFDVLLKGDIFGGFDTARRVTLKTSRTYELFN